MNHNTNLSPDKLIQFFVNHLNRIYCAKSHLRERLPEIRDQTDFKDLTEAITVTLIDVDKQLSRMDNIYQILNISYNFEQCMGMVGLIEDTYDAIHATRDNAALRDLSILFYMQNIESIQQPPIKC
jgi:ferritin-like metal-binding protein YciE